MVGLLVFGGTDPVSQFVVSESAFEFGFSRVGIGMHGASVVQHH
jgi:hypothetical protein